MSAPVRNGYRVYDPTADWWHNETARERKARKRTEAEARQRVSDEAKFQRAVDAKRAEGDR